MMYCEFIERTKFNENYMTMSDYKNYIEPAYMECEYNKDVFCEKFYKAYTDNVYKIVDMMISAQSVETLTDYIEGETKLADVEFIESQLKTAFLKTCVKRFKGWKF